MSGMENVASGLWDLLMLGAREQAMYLDQQDPEDKVLVTFVEDLPANSLTYQ